MAAFGLKSPELSLVYWFLISAILLRQKRRRRRRSWFWMKGESLKCCSIYLPASAFPGGVGWGGEASVWRHCMHTDAHARTFECLRTFPLRTRQHSGLTRAPTSQAVQLTWNSFLLELSPLWAVGGSQLQEGQALMLPPTRPPQPPSPTTAATPQPPPHHPNLPFLPHWADLLANQVWLSPDHLSCSLSEELQGGISEEIN